MKALLGGFVMVLGLASVGSAAPIYVTGGECPADPLDAAYTRQYYVTPSLRCMFDPSDNNIQGTDAEADLYLNSAAGTAAGWGTASPSDDWNGLGQNAFDFTADAGNDDGTFTITTAGFNQFAIAIKDGSVPFWAIFELGVNQTTGNWGFSTNGGSLSHFALFARNVSSFPPPPPPPPSEVPEPASLFLLGSGLMWGVRKYRKV